MANYLKHFLTLFIMLYNSFSIGAQPTHQKFILMIMLYNETNPARCQEYITCMEKNLRHSSVKHIHVIFDTTNNKNKNTLLEYLKTKNVDITYFNGRATYGDFFSLAHQLYGNSAIIISNADIYFDETLQLLETYDLSNKFLAITRWDLNKDGSERIYFSHWDKEKQLFIPYSDAFLNSQDVWIYKDPLPKFKYDKFPLGTKWCDPYIAYQAKDAGLVVFNPCYSIKCHHLHTSGIRHWPDTNPKYPWLPLQWSILKSKLNLISNGGKELNALLLPYEFLLKP